ncbi:hypothetical protein NM313_2138 [Neisseria meningitidis NM313]|nr:hypothetical protein NM313_2138 [Neisseria meningitidis NM313]
MFGRFFRRLLDRFFRRFRDRLRFRLRLWFRFFFGFRLFFRFRLFLRLLNIRIRLFRNHRLQNRLGQLDRFGRLRLRLRLRRSRRTCAFGCTVPSAKITQIDKFDNIS